jgi:hypothetical protein
MARAAHDRAGQDEPWTELAVQGHGVKDYFPNSTADPTNRLIYKRAMDEEAAQSVMVGLTVIVFILSLMIGIFGP